MTPRISDIKRETCAMYGVTDVDLHSDRRSARVARPRQVAMYLARSLTAQSLPAIGRSFGRDHTTVMHAVEAVERRMAFDEVVADRVQTLRTRVLESVVGLGCGDDVTGD